MTPDAQAFHGYSYQDNVGTSNTNCLRTAQALKLMDHTGTIIREATLKSVSDTGFTLDHTVVDVTTHKAIVVAWR